MYARTVVASTTALLGTAALALFPARAAGSDTPPLVVAHRGASGYAPENTLPAADKAAELGVDWVENDVQRTRDGELVVLHDDSLARTTDVEEVFPDRSPWKVRDFTAAEIARLDAGSWFGPAFAGTRVPTLEQFLRRLERHGQKLLLEIKNPRLYPGIEGETLQTLDNEGWLDRAHLRNRLVVQSFSADSVRAVHELEPEVRTGFIGKPPVKDLPVYADFADRINSPHAALSSGYVTVTQSFRGPHGKPLKVLAWTVDDAAAARRAAGLGVDGIVSNKPDVVRDAVGG
ncbi:glycerophosphodiester phosphodiesterase [Streptomyces sp. MAR25Y5]|uniref:glycerophosphodiester phosphodiesterase n=1 Tax=Streptomyces sp. MAR25Y5 TaxID=2962028 RepID=UPI0020B76AF8|nr:glycerophosphodiester phosphodiesterase family protein [Streptomyces sp. MAR25Y5]MCP3766069.1 glycerophosphodiester phosphodiesterase [Streptomyces sp. MAR25Y5]